VNTNFENLLVPTRPRNRTKVYRRGERSNQEATRQLLISWDWPAFRRWEHGIRFKL